LIAEKEGVFLKNQSDQCPQLGDRIGTAVDVFAYELPYALTEGEGILIQRHRSLNRLTEAQSNQKGEDPAKVSASMLRANGAP